MLFSDMSTVNSLVSDAYIPRMFRIRQTFPRPALDVKCIPQIVRKELEKEMVGERIHPGMSIAITAGSRMIANSAMIMREIVQFVREYGGEPFLVPAMGSHGGAVAEGQTEMLETLGITESSVGCPIKSSMETVCVGHHEEGGEVHMDRNAFEADGVIVFNRIKPHSGFRGTYESGIVKMMAVGLGKQHGAAAIHSGGDETLARNIYLHGKTILENANILFAVGVMENAYDETAEIHVIKSEDILQEELVCLKKAFTMMPRILVDTCDVLIVENIGKNYCGGGMDSNITGRFYSELFSGWLKAQRIGVLNLSDESHGNANGIGMADVICKRAFDKIDAATTYPNAITTTCHRNVAIPIVMENDRLVIQTCLKGCYNFDIRSPRIIYIKNTLELEHVWLSEAFMEEVSKKEGVEIETSPQELGFDEKGMICRLP